MDKSEYTAIVVIVGSVEELEPMKWKQRKKNREERWLNRKSK